MFGIKLPFQAEDFLIFDLNPQNMKGLNAESI